uniref:Solute carrier family 30 member 10 n=1 Tax=Erpetoichthys calabaricus TaxID=27687 RepID=A0A8C4X3C2_ERPCA
MGRYSGKTCRLIFMMFFLGSFFLAELVSGYLGNSIALMSDSFNMLSDLISVTVGMSALRLGRRERTGRFTYGLPRAEVVGALCNAVFLTALCFTIFVQAIMRLVEPEKIENAELVLIVGALGLGINLFGLVLFQDFSNPGQHRTQGRKPIPGRAPTHRRTHTPRHQAHTKTNLELPIDLTCMPLECGRKPEQLFVHLCPCWILDCSFLLIIVSAFLFPGVVLHLMGDALGSLVVVVTAVIFFVLPLGPEDSCNWECYIDPSLTIAMVIIILSSVFPLIREAVSILLHMVPEGLHVDEITLRKVPGVQGMHELHIWKLAAGRNVATLHVKCADAVAFEALNHQIREIFHNIGVHSTTIQPELTYQEKPLGRALSCTASCLSRGCEQQMCLGKTRRHLDEEMLCPTLSSPCLSPVAIVCTLDRKKQTT